MSSGNLLHKPITKSIIGAFYRVHNSLGFGFLEQVYVSALERALREAGHGVAREYAVRVYYEGQDVGFHRLDLLVDDVVIVEVKSTSELPGIAKRQLYNYLNATNLEVGLLLHFGPSPKFHRVLCARLPKC